MADKSPARAGFALVIRRPALIFAEIAWRWCFGLAALALLGLTSVLFLSSIRVTDSDMQLARSGSPWIAADILAHLLQANGAPLLRALAVLIPGTAVLWTLAAAVGRAITIPALIRGTNDPSRAETAGVVSGHDFSRAATASAAGRASSGTNFGALLGISFLRATITLALVVGYFGCALIAAAFSNFLGGEPSGQIAAFLLVFLPLFLLVIVAWGILNWFLSLAPIFAVRDGRATFAGFSDTVRLYRANRRQFIAIGSGYGLAKTVAVVIVTVAGFVLVGALVAAPSLLTAALIAITLAYFAFADLLNLARLASYAVLAETFVRDPADQAVPVTSDAPVVP